jgi:hypothetical protein
VSHATISERQGYVIAQLYERFGWSATTIATTLGLKRRQVENAIRRAGVTIARRSKKAFLTVPVLTPEAALDWFTKAAFQEHPTLEPQRVNTGVTYVYRRRRCQPCGLLNAYTTHCSRCGQELDFKKPSTQDQDIAATIEDACRAQQP